MELKLICGVINLFFFNLLIVPYGIETGIRFYDIHQRALLIVPYGIETILLRRRYFIKTFF